MPLQRPSHFGGRKERQGSDVTVWRHLCGCWRAGGVACCTYAPCAASTLLPVLVLLCQTQICALDGAGETGWHLHCILLHTWPKDDPLLAQEKRGSLPTFTYWDYRQKMCFKSGMLPNQPGFRVLLPCKERISHSDVN